MPHGAHPTTTGTACGDLTCHGVYAATRDPTGSPRSCAAVPGGMLAIRTGAPSGSVVVDIDPRNGGRASRRRERGMVPPTTHVRTGSRRAGTCTTATPAVPVQSSGRLSPGVDVNADGGYVVAPPAIHPRTGRRTGGLVDRAMGEMPPALVGACRAVPARER